MKVDVNKFLKPCSCGRKHEIIVDDIIIESGAVSRLPEILARDAYKNFQNIVMICDENTYEAAGKTVERLVPGLKKAVLDPETSMPMNMAWRRHKSILTRWASWI